MKTFGMSTLAALLVAGVMGCGEPSAPPAEPAEGEAPAAEEAAGEGSGTSEEAAEGSGEAE